MRTSLISKLIGMAFAAALAIGAANAWAADADQATGGYGPYGMGPGMMWGGGGYGPGYGMMGGYGPYGMGPGMMGGYGMGPGMMGGYGMGPGMMGYGPLGSLDLSDEQRTKINKIIDAEHKQHWAIMGQMMEEQNKMRDLFSADEPDPKTAGSPNCNSKCSRRRSRRRIRCSRSSPRNSASGCGNGSAADGVRAGDRVRRTRDRALQIRTRAISPAGMG